MQRVENELISKWKQEIIDKETGIRYMI